MHYIFALVAVWPGLKNGVNVTLYQDKSVAERDLEAAKVKYPTAQWSLHSEFPLTGQAYIEDLNLETVEV